MGSSFIRFFPRAALVFSAMTLLVMTAPVAVAFMLSPEQMKSPELPVSPLAGLVVEHFRAFSLGFWLYFALAVVASIGLLRRRRWAHSLWVLLLVLGVVWSVAFMTSEIVYVLGTDVPADEMGGYFPPQPTLGALVAVPTGVVILVFLGFLLRGLLSQDAREAYRSPPRQ